ncbi:MAG: glycosyltransferase family 2 protein [Lachnospiraceae bacterium]|nr:glycosyltransferase family 2 protein [Lachnospiraceae bacterium]
MDIKLFQQLSNRQGEKISLIIPCYNREKYIAQCIESILNQTFPLELMEIIIVDDCSSDSTIMIIEEYEKKYPDTILLIKCTEQSGGFVGKVRNIGMQYATGSYISFVDSDDLLAPEALEKLYIQAIAHGADVVACNYYMFENDSIIGNSAKREHLYETSNKDSFALLIMDEALAGWIWGKLYSKDFLGKNNISFPDDKHISEDSLFHASCLFTLKRMVCISDALYYYRRNPKGIWNSKTALEYVDELVETWVVLWKSYYKYGMSVIKELEWAAYGSVFMLKKKCLEMGNSDVFRSRLPMIKTELLEAFPNVANNPLIYQDKSKLNLELQEDLFSEI